MTAARSQCAQSTSAWKSSQLAQRLAPTPSGHHLRGQAGQRHCPTPANVLAVTGSAEATVSAHNLEYRNRFWILSDKVYGFGCDYGGAGVGVERLVATRFWRSFAVKTTFNSGTAGTVADIATNSLYLLAISDTATAAQQHRTSSSTRASASRMTNKQSSALVPFHFVGASFSTKFHAFQSHSILMVSGHWAEVAL